MKKRFEILYTILVCSAGIWAYVEILPKSHILSYLYLGLMLLCIFQQLVRAVLVEIEEVNKG